MLSHDHIVSDLPKSPAERFAISRYRKKKNKKKEKKKQKKKEKKMLPAPFAKLKRNSLLSESDRGEFSL